MTAADLEIEFDIFSSFSSLDFRKLNFSISLVEKCKYAILFSISSSATFLMIMMIAIRESVDQDFDQLTICIVLYLFDGI
jgi:hypothetical protein